MSAIAEAATVSLELADYAATDAAGKINLLGGGLNAVGFVPVAGLTAAFALVVTIFVPPEYYGEECALEIILEDDSGQVVALPGPAPDQPQKMRVGQAVTLEEPKFPAGTNIPRRMLPARVSVVLAFTNGLPLAIGQRYTWRVRIDHESKDQWIYRFFVPGPAPGPVIG
ncbi:MAG: hypothetical protein HYR62_08795 [Actinobacteria bacterium]|nr:hypothetical protein [Actinomycetota bacterium]MBI3688420.1 hypothetical protein [Actinomycetota bacterium]